MNEAEDDRMSKEAGMSAVAGLVLLAAPVSDHAHFPLPEHYVGDSPDSQFGPYKEVGSRMELAMEQVQMFHCSSNSEDWLLSEWEAVEDTGLFVSVCEESWSMSGAPYCCEHCQSTLLNVVRAHRQEANRGRGLPN